MSRPSSVVRTRHSGPRFSGCAHQRAAAAAGWCGGGQGGLVGPQLLDDAAGVVQVGGAGLALDPVAEHLDQAGPLEGRLGGLGHRRFDPQQAAGRPRKMTTCSPSKPTK